MSGNSEDTLALPSRVNLLDEINLAEPEIIERINSILDDDAFLVINENGGITVKRGKEFHLFTAMNPSYYAGRNRLSIAMLNKFHQIWFLQDLQEEEEMAIVKHYFDRQREEVKTNKEMTEEHADVIGEMAAKISAAVVGVLPIVLLALMLGILFKGPHIAVSTLLMGTVLGPGFFSGLKLPRERKSIKELLLKYSMAVAKEEPGKTGLDWFDAIKGKIKSAEVNRVVKRLEAVAKIYSNDFSLRLKPSKGTDWGIAS